MRGRCEGCGNARRLFEQSCATDYHSFLEGFAAGQKHVDGLYRQALEKRRR